VITDDAVIEDSAEYRSEIKIKVDYRDEGFSVQIFAPKQLKSFKLNSASLFVGSMGSPDLWVPLKAMEEAGEKVFWYIVKSSLAKNHWVSISYGDCGLSLKYPVKFIKKT